MLNCMLQNYDKSSLLKLNNQGFDPQERYVPLSFSTLFLGPYSHNYSQFLECSGIRVCMHTLFAEHVYTANNYFKLHKDGNVIQRWAVYKHFK